MILITGKTGVGKTTILKETKLNNIYYMDDVIKNKFYNFYNKLYWQIKKEFGKEVVSLFKVKNNKLGKIVLNNIKKMNKLNKLIKPYVISYLKKLNPNSIIEMAAYINLEKDYKKYFDFVILIEKNKPILKNKFTYLNKKPNLIKNKKIKFNYLIKNNNISNSAKKLRSIILNLI